MSFQELILALRRFWAEHGCLVVSPYNSEVGAGVITFATMMLLIGATGKSAQIPLYVWLPDAMEGPTPVSALIHAATMVTAGVYMVVRSNVLFSLAPATMTAVAVIGAAESLGAPGCPLSPPQRTERVTKMAASNMARL